MCLGFRSRPRTETTPIVPADGADDAVEGHAHHNHDAGSAVRASVSVLLVVGSARWAAVGFPVLQAAVLSRAWTWSISTCRAGSRSRASPRTDCGGLHDFEDGAPPNLSVCRTADEGQKRRPAVFAVDKASADVQI
jgi:hypothetical protein